MQHDIPTAFRCTLNKPGMLLVVGDAPSVDLRRLGGGLVLRPSRSRGSFTVEPRERGGGEFSVEGERAAELWPVLLDVAGGPGKPFYSLVREGEWFRLTPEPAAPPRYIPHLRVWRAEPAAPVRVETWDDEPTWASRIRHAASVVQAHEAASRIGRPSREVVEAMALMETFKRLATDLLAPSADRALVQQARELLDRALNSKAAT